MRDSPHLYMGKIDVGLWSDYCLLKGNGLTLVGLLIHCMTLMIIEFPRSIRSKRMIGFVYRACIVALDCKTDTSLCLYRSPRSCVYRASDSMTES